MQIEVRANRLEELIEQGNACLEHKNLQQALLFFNSIVLLSPQHIEAVIRCAEILLALNRSAEATIYTKHALKLKSDRKILTIHAQALYKMGRYLEALDCFECILAEDPKNCIAMGQRALCLTQVNRYEEALVGYQQAVECSKNKDAWLYYNYSLCLLAMGNLPLGFSYFENRWLTVLLERRRAWTMPEYASAKKLQGKTILVHSEQGLGDSIQFFRYIPMLLQMGARVILEIQPALIPLFLGWRHTICFIAQGSPLPSCDYHCPMMSLAIWFKTEMNTIPSPIPYLFPDIHAFENCQRKFANSKRSRVGIAWRGSLLNAMNPKRSIELITLLRVHHPHFDFFCLQNDVNFEEKKQLDRYRIAYHSLELDTMRGTAALIASLDLVITIDTSIAHLAAAMGKAVWILLPFSADWRWFLQRKDSPWYPNVKLFRQEALNDWRAPLVQIKNALLAFPPIQDAMVVEDLLRQADVSLQNGSLLEAKQRYINIFIKHPACHRALQGAALVALQLNKMAEAIQFMQQAAEIAPQMVIYKRNLGELLRRVGQFETSIAAHQIAIKVEPLCAENHFLLALAYNDSRQFKLAIEHYHIALSMDKNYGLAWNNLGVSLENLGNKHEAKNAYATAIRLNPNHAEAQNNLGAIYSEEGQIDDARRCFEAAIAANPHCMEAHYNLTLVKTYAPSDPHLVFLQGLIKKIDHYPVMSRIHYYFALGKGLDDCQQYRDAFKAYKEGNRLYCLQNPWDKTKLRENVEYIPSVFTASFLKQPKKTNEPRCPIFIVGMPRAGTTLIEQILSSHEGIYGAGELSILDDIIQKACRESSLPFNTWVTQLTDEEFTALGQKYLDETWKLAPDKQYIIDKMPANFFYIGIIYRMLPTAKIIHAIRDPMDSCFSCFTHLFKNSMLFANSLVDLGEYYSLYARTMQYWQKMLPSTVIFNVSYEHMVDHYEALSRQLIAYIGLAWDPNCLDFYQNNRVVKTASLAQVRKPIYKTSVQRWQYFAEELKPLLEIVAPYRNKKGISA